jgi:hypothetical protein
MSQQLAQIAAINPGCARGALDEVVGFGANRRAADEFA